MSPSRILIGQFLIVLTIIVATMWGATQWVAHAFGYQPALGRPWFIWGEVPVYRPWRLFQWWYAYEAYAPDVFARGGALAASGGLLGILAAVVGSVWRSRWEKRVTTYGSTAGVGPASRISLRALRSTEWPLRLPNWRITPEARRQRQRARKHSAGGLCPVMSGKKSR